MYVLFNCPFLSKKKKKYPGSTHDNFPHSGDRTGSVVGSPSRPHNAI